jgi:trimethyllysine dioxygenase
MPFLEFSGKDGHESFYKMDFLHQNQYEVHKQVIEETNIVLWNKEQIETADYARVCLSDLICNDEPIKIVMQSLIKYGIAFIEKVPANTQSTEMAIKRWGLKVGDCEFHQILCFGVFFQTFSNKKDTIW